MSMGYAMQESFAYIISNDAKEKHEYIALSQNFAEKVDQYLKHILCHTVTSPKMDWALQIVIKLT